MRKALAVLLACAACAGAQGLSFQSSRFPANHKSYTLAAGDFNGDGLPDLVVPDDGIFTRAASVLLNLGNGKFGPPATIALPQSAAGAAVGDFNGDGRVDLAIATLDGATGSHVSIALGNGDGTFQPVVNYLIENPAINVVVGDFNHDGKLDLAVGNFTGGSGPKLYSDVAVLLGNGDGTFQKAVNYTNDGRVTSLVAGDFTGSGNLDLAVDSSHQSTVWLLAGNGDGSFKPQQAVFQPGPPMHSMTAADLNGDGKLDLVTTAYTTKPKFGGVLVALGNGDGTFQAPVKFAVGKSPYQVITGDFNNDGKLDLAVSDPSAQRVGVLLGNGDGTFQAPQYFRTREKPRYLIAVDVNQDGWLDILAGCGKHGICELLNTTK